MAPRLAQLVSNAIAARGQPIFLRTVQTSALGPVPPILDAPATAANLAQGATVMALDCTSATGQLVAGDRITVAGQTVVVAAAVQSRPLVADVTPGFDGVVVAPPLSEPVAAGAGVVIQFAADKPVKALVNVFSTHVVDGVNILAKDLRVQIGAYNQAEPDPATQKLIVRGDIRTIVNVDPNYGPGGEITKWVLQAR